MKIKNSAVLWISFFVFFCIWTRPSSWGPKELRAHRRRHRHMRGLLFRRPFISDLIPTVLQLLFVTFPAVLSPTAPSLSSTFPFHFIVQLFPEIHGILSGFPKCYTLCRGPGVTWFHWVLLGFSEFHLVLLGFTGFYWVLMGFNGF